ncbi:MAG: acyl-CoA thioesterase [Clostridia bacterium]|nr:acyl-CoA thioesterase [Clostridia bacterium]
MKKTPSQTYTEQVNLVKDSELNGSRRLFGGILLSWIDITAAIVARRHAERDVTTVAIDDLHFIAPAHANDLVVLCGKMTYVGRTSMEITVESYVERLDGTRTLINRAHVVMVALGPDDRPCEVPGLEPETDEERAEMAAGERRKQLRVQRQTEKY